MGFCIIFAVRENESSSCIHTGILPQKIGHMLSRSIWASSLDLHASGPCYVHKYTMYWIRLILGGLHLVGGLCAKHSQILKT